MKNRIKNIISSISGGVFEKEHIISLALLSSIAGESIFLLGPPGTAKSMVARRLKLVFKDSSSFEYLMSRFSTPDEIFGPISISRLKNEDVYERCTEGYLPTATIVFFDEIWKAGPAIQNALLTAINERIYRNGRKTARLPMKTLIAASNELPKEDEGLEALWDRFLLRVVSDCIRDEKTFYRMLRQTQEVTVTVPENLLITDAEFMAWQEQIGKVDVPDEILKSITDIRKCLNGQAEKEDMNPFDYYVSDRRWKKAVHLLQASAFLNGRDAIDFSDMYLLTHVLWNKAEDIEFVWEILQNCMFGDIDKSAEGAEKELEQIKRKVLPTDMGMDESDFKVYSYFYLRLVDFPRGQCYIFQTDFNSLTNRYKIGVVYFDDKLKAYVLRCFYSAQSFSGTAELDNMQKVKMRKLPGGVLDVDGRHYTIEKKIPTARELPFNAGTLKDVTEKIGQIRTALKQRTDILTDGGNLFVAAGDRKTVRKNYDKRMQHLEHLEVKIAGLVGGPGRKG